MENKFVTYEYLDNLFSEAVEAQNYVLNNLPYFQNRPYTMVKYSLDTSSHLGNEMPSLFMADKRKFLKKAPDKPYFEYRYDSKGNIVSLLNYLESNDDLVCSSIYYFTEKDGYIYAVALYDENKLASTYVFKYKYIDEKVNYVSYITKNSLWLELYDWSNNLCEVWYYVPNLTGSTKAVPIGQEKSPAKKIVKSLDFSVKSYSDKVYKEWLSSVCDCFNDKYSVYISIKEMFSSQFAIFVSYIDAQGNECVISDELVFVFRNSWSSLLTRIKNVTKTFFLTKNYVGDVFLGFVDGDLFLINQRDNQRKTENLNQGTVL